MHRTSVERERRVTQQIERAGAQTEGGEERRNNKGGGGGTRFGVCLGRIITYTRNRKRRYHTRSVRMEAWVRETEHRM